MQHQENNNHRTPVSNALEIVPSNSRPLSAESSYGESTRYYGPSNRVEEGVRLRDVWIAISKRRWLIVFIVLLITATTAFMLARKPDIYLAESEVQVDTEGPASGLTTGKGNAIIVDTFTDPSYFNTELQIISKPGLLRRVVKTLDLENNQDFLRAQAGDTAWQRLMRTFGVGGKHPVQQPIQKTNNDRLLMVKQVAPSSSNDLEEATRLEPYVSSIQSGLKVEPVKEERLQFTGTRLISIKFTHASPLVAAKVANAIADTFVLSNLEQKTKFTNTTGDFLQQRIAELQSQIRSDEERLINYAKGHEILSLDAAQNTVVDRLAGLNKQLLEAENERKMAEAAYRVNKEPGAAAVLAASGAKEGGARELESQLAVLKQKREQLLAENTEEWPEVKEIQKQIALVEKQLVDANAKVVSTESKAMEMRYQQALGREQALRAAFEEQRGATRTQNEAAINYHIIQQEIQTNKGLLDGLLQRAKENDVILAGTPNNLHVTDYAIPPRTPIGPNRLQGIMLAFVFSLGFGVGLAVMLEYLDDSVRSTEDVSKVLRLPTLATIPALKTSSRRAIAAAPTSLLPAKNGNGNGNDSGNGHGRVNSALLLDLDQRSPLAEAYRRLRTSVLLSSPGHAPKTLVVTSCVPSEGKSTTAINLAVTLAQTGARVLVIDGDMRRPTVHSSFGIENRGGLSNILSNEMSSVETLALVQKEKSSGIYLLTSGPIPPNPAELVGSEQMRNLLAELAKTFDHIVIDTPPIASFTDGVLLATLADGVILVIHANECSRKVVQRAHQSLQEVRARVLGVVLNRIHVRSADYGDYYYHAYYRGHEAEYESSETARAS